MGCLVSFFFGGEMLCFFWGFNGEFFFCVRFFIGFFVRFAHVSVVTEKGGFAERE